MAYTLKASGIATKLTMCLAVDEGGTVKEFVSSSVNTDMTVGAGVTISDGTWKSVTRKYFQTASAANGAITFGTNKPTMVSSSSAQCSIYVAAQDVAAASFLYGAIVAMNADLSTDWWGREYGTDRFTFHISGGKRVTSTTAPATNTRFSACTTINDNTTGQNAVYYGLESDANLTSETITNNAIYGFTKNIHQVGGTNFSNGKFYLIATFNDDLTAGEWESLHDDWFGTLFDSGGSVAPLVTLATRSPAPFTINY